MSEPRFTCHTLAEILRDRFLGEESGRLFLAGDTGEEIRIHFSVGLLDLALQNGPHLQFLADLLASSQKGMALPPALRQEPPGPAALADLLGEAVSRPEVRQAVRSETLVSVQEAFRLSGGHWRFEPGQEPGCFEPEVPFTLEAFLKGIGAVTRWARVGRILGAQKRCLRPAAVPLFQVERLPLAPEEGYLLGLMDGQVTFEDLRALFPGSDPDQVTRFVYAGLVLGIVEFEPALASPFRLEAYAEQDREVREREDRELDRIDRFYETLRRSSPYGILGVTDGASWDEIRHAYEERKESFRAELFLPDVRTQRREELKIIETGLVEAYLKVQSLRMDAAGERNRERAAESPASLEDMKGRRLEQSKTSRQAEQDENVRRAEQYLQQARDHYREGDFHNTIQFCNLALKHADTLAECHALLGQALERNPDRRWQLRAEKELKRALELDPWNPHFYLHLGEFYRRQGMEQRAARYFEKAFRISPSLRAAAGDNARPST